MQLSDEQLALKARAAALADGMVRARAAEVDATREYPWDIVEALKAERFMGMTIPHELGGEGRSFMDAVLVIEELARACTVTARIVVEANMGAISTVMAYGTEDQKRLAAGLVLAGDKPAICITEPEAGSDAGGMTTRADKRGNRWVVNGRKHWITGGGVSRLHLIFARAFDEAGEALGVGGFLAVRGETNGLLMVRRETTMGLCGMPEGELAFEDMEVTPDMVLMPPGGFRRGFAELINAYNSQRVGAGTVAMGIAAGALEHAVAWAKSREQFGRPIGEFQGLQWMLADMQTQLGTGPLRTSSGVKGAPSGAMIVLRPPHCRIFSGTTAVTVVMPPSIDGPLCAEPDGTPTPPRICPTHPTSDNPVPETRNGSELMEAGYLGVGAMGLPMATKLLDGGHQLTVLDINDDAVRPFTERQCPRATTPRELADRHEIVFVSLPTLGAYRHVVFGDNGLLQGGRMKILVNTCTVGMPFLREVEAAMAQKGVTIVDCPISGGPAGARGGALSVMVSGSPDAVEAVRPMISLWGQTLTVCGDRPGPAQVLKLTNNILFAVSLAATCEAFVMGAKGGLDPEVMMTAIGAGSGANRAQQMVFAGPILSRRFDMGGAMHILVKDVDLALELADELGIPMWVCQAARLVFKHAMFEGRGNDDISTIVQGIERGAKFEIPKTR